MSETPMGPCGSSQCATQCAYFVHSHGTMHCRPWHDAKEPHNATRHLAPVAAVGMPPRDQPQVPPPGPTETRREEWVVQCRGKAESGPWVDLERFLSKEPAVAVAPLHSDDDDDSRIIHRITTIIEREVRDE